jgi:hypothetical protein
MAFMRSGVRSPSAPPSNNPESQTTDYKRRAWLPFAALFLFLATAAVVVWQDSRLAILWDLSYVLENAYRISLGDVPYRDFPFPYPPLTFLVQAGIIKLAGRVFWHTIVYSAIVGGLGTVLTWRIILNVLCGKIVHAGAVAFLLSLPLIPLGIYSVFPHPFYDPDCTFAILLALFLFQTAERQPSSLPWPVLCGISLVLPLFGKQNTGLPFLISVLLGTVFVATVERFHGRPIRRYVLIMFSVLITLTIGLLLIHLTAGLKNYWHWTVQFAAVRRTPALTDMLEIYTSRPVLLSIVVVVIGFTVGWFIQNRGRWSLAVSSAIIAALFVWPAIYLAIDHDPSERAERLLNLWPLVLVISLLLAIATLRRRRELNLILPFVLIVTINGAFLSQQLWGSTYAIWPLFIILIADGLAATCVLPGNRLNAAVIPPFEEWTSPRSKRAITGGAWVLSFVLIIAASLLISGGAYVHSHERLDYANLDEGPPMNSWLPQLKGMRTRGDWLPNFEELVSYADREIPRDDAILIIPGEDLFYYTTGRRPQFPVLLFDRTVNPYAPEQILNLARERNIRWLVIKQDLQDEDEELEKQRDELTEALEQEFEQIESLKNYDIYKRAEPGEDEK